MNAIRKYFAATCLKVFIGLCSILITVLASTNTIAASTTISFSGVISGNEPLLNPVITLGDLISGQITYDTDSPDSNSSPETGSYYTAITAYEFNIGSFFGSSSGGRIFVNDNKSINLSLTGDSINFSTNNNSNGLVGPNIGDWMLGAISVLLIDSSQSVFDSDALPSEQLDPLDFDIQQSIVVFTNISSPTSVISVGFDVQSFSVVPIPGAFWLFGTGLIGLVGIAKCKKA